MIFRTRLESHNPAHDPTTIFGDFFAQVFGHCNPKAHVEVTESGYIIHVLIPGIDPETVKLDVKDGTLTILAPRHEEATHPFAREGFSGSWELPDTADINHIGATSSNGILAVYVPVDMKHKTVNRTIKIQV